MERTTRMTAAALVGTVLIVILALLLEAASGPTFRPEDYGSYQECLANIPTEWAPGSLQREGAQDACLFVHQRR